MQRSQKGIDYEHYHSTTMSDRPLKCWRLGAILMWCLMTWQMAKLNRYNVNLFRPQRSLWDESSSNSSSLSMNDTTFITNETKRNVTCALLFFGLVRNAEIVFPSIHDYVIAPNHDCDVYAHTYSVSNESGIAIETHRINELTDHFVVDNETEFHAARNVTYYRQFTPPAKEGWVYPTSIDNMIKQWHSIERVWDLMESAGQPYRRIGLFRVDTLYTHPISIRHGEAVIPYFMNWIGKHGNYIMLNDRLFYGTRENAEIWKTRFDRVEEYLPGPWGYLHSEKYLGWIMSNVTMERKPICIHRVRANGFVKVNDCLTHEQMLEKAIELDRRPKCDNER